MSHHRDALNIFLYMPVIIIEIGIPLTFASLPRPASLPQNQNQSPSNRKSMEEVWKEITFASLPLADYSNNSLFTTTTTHSHSSFSSFFLHELLVSPCHKDTSKSLPESTLMASLEQPLPHPTPTMPTFTSASDFNRHTLLSFLSSSNPSLDASDSSTLCHCNSTKKAEEEISNFNDRRHKRKIKNRESAARSRARKQAYTNELELELARQRDENAKLKRQQEKFCLTNPARHHKKSNSV